MARERNRPKGTQKGTDFLNKHGDKIAGALGTVAVLTPYGRILKGLKVGSQALKRALAAGGKKFGSTKAAQAAAKKLSGVEGRKAARNRARGNAGYKTKTGEAVVRDPKTGRMKKASPSQTAAGEKMAEAGGRSVANRRLRRGALKGAAAAGVGGAAYAATPSSTRTSNVDKTDDARSGRNSSSTRTPNVDKTDDARAARTRASGKSTVDKTDDKRAAATRKSEGPMSFSEAFAKARKEKGPNGTFTWRGEKYHTRRADDKNTVDTTDDKRAAATRSAKSSPKKSSTSGVSLERNASKGKGKYAPTEKGDKLRIGKKKVSIEAPTFNRKKGGQVTKRKAGGKVRKAGCKRGMGKAQRGY